MFGFENLFFIFLYKLAELFDSSFVDLTEGLRGDSLGSASWRNLADVFFVGWLVGVWVTIMLATSGRKSPLAPIVSGGLTALSAILWYVALCRA